jgi:hypothetical protein
MEYFSVWHWLVVLLVSSPIVFYILSFRKTAKAVNADGGSAPMNSAWLLLIPLFGMIWFFVLLFQLRGAMRNTKSGEPDNQWWVLGILAAGLSVVAIFVAMAPGILSILVLVAQFTLAVLHWIKIVQIRKHFQPRL